MEVTTPWFPPHDKPERSGPYEILTKSAQEMFSFWNVETRTWGFLAYTPAAAVGMRDKPSRNQNKVWRGILKWAKTT